MVRCGFNRVDTDDTDDCLRSIMKSSIIFAILKMLVFLFENSKRTMQIMLFKCLLIVVLSNKCLTLINITELEEQLPLF